VRGLTKIYLLPLWGLEFDDPTLKDITIGIKNGENPEKCPECGEKGIQYKFAGELETRIGFLAIWCVSCNQGIHISRTNIPEYEEMLPFNKASNMIHFSRTADKESY
jgi:predicted RNA-binding Zn-ribbon protein involved in translation (DUF1610 family)